MFNFEIIFLSYNFNGINIVAYPEKKINPVIYLYKTCPSFVPSLASGIRVKWNHSNGTRKLRIV